MIHSAFIALVQNSALLLALVVVFDLATSDRRFPVKRLQQLVIGVVVGCFSVGLIMAAYRLESGIIFDTRSVLLCISGLFLGPLPTIVAMAIAAMYRLWQGGTAMWMGAAVIFATGSMGMLWRSLRHGKVDDLSARELYLFGVVTHLIMLALTFVLPTAAALRILAVICLPVLLVYPVAVTALGMLLVKRLHRESIVVNLAESEELLAKAQQLAQVGSWTLSLPENCLTGSDELYRIFGITPQSRAVPFGDLLAQVHPDDVSAVAKAHAPGEGSLDFFEIEYRVIRQGTAEMRHLHERGFYERAPGGAIVRSVGVVQDITDRMRLYEALQDERRRLAEILKATAVGTWEWHVQTGETVFNERWAEIVGYTLAELSPVSIDTWLKLAHPEDLKVSENLLERHFNGELDHYECEARIRHKNGTWVWVFDSGQVVEWTAEGKPLRMSGTHLDITARKHMEEALKQGEEKLRIITESAQDAILMMDANGAISYWNPAAEKIFGYRSEEVLGEHLHELLAPDHSLAAFHQAFPDFLRSGQGNAINRTLELKARKYDGGEFDIALSLSANLVQGEWHAVGIIRDITERRQLEARTLQIARLTSLGEMASGVAHEINNPVTGILGCAELLNDRLPPESSCRPIANRIIREANRIARIVKSLLSTVHPGLSREERFAIKECIASVMTLYESRLEKAGIDCILVLAEDLPLLTGDRQKIEQLLLNLLSNSYYALNHKFPDGDPAKQLRLGVSSRESCGRRWLQLEVHDQGSGIHPDIFSKIFDPFFTTKPAGSGTGLGLGICYDIIKQHGGEIRIESEFGQFTRVLVELPVTQEQASTF